MPMRKGNENRNANPRSRERGTLRKTPSKAKARRPAEAAVDQRKRKASGEKDQLRDTFQRQLAGINDQLSNLFHQYVDCLQKDDILREEVKQGQ